MFNNNLNPRKTGDLSKHIPSLTNRLRSIAGLSAVSSSTRRRRSSSLSESDSDYYDYSESGYGEDDVKGSGAYVGLLGVALALKSLGDSSGSKEIGRICEDEISGKRQESFLEGEQGLALHAWRACGFVSGGSSHDASEFAELAAAARHSRGSNELLYGRAGVLHGCLLVLKYARELSSSIRADIVDTAGALLAEIVDEGGDDASGWAWPWHGKTYIGAIHGIAGVLAQIAQCPREVIDASGVSRERLTAGIEATTASLVNMQSSSGHFPSSSHSSRGGDPLCQICHGAPGVLVSLIAVRRAIPKGNSRLRASVKSACVRAAEATYESGLLRKGPGLCHGVSGNALALLVFSREEFGGAAWARKARAMIAFALSERFRHGDRRHADRPGSLFEGDAGVAYVLGAIENGRLGLFPGIEV